MPWKKDDNDGIVIGESGNPVFVYPDGNEVDFDADRQVVKIRELTEKASKRKTSLDTANGSLSLLTEAGIDVEDNESIKTYIKAAKTNADTVKNYDDKDMVAADEVQKIKDEEAKRYTDQIAANDRKYKTAIETKDALLVAKDASIHKSIVRNAFLTSDFVKNKTSYPTAEIAYRDLQGKFIVEEVDGEAVAFGIDRDGDKLHSLKDPTDYAGAHEAIEIIITNHPQKEALLLAEGTGTGAEAGKKKTLASTKIVQHADKEAFGVNIEKIASGEVRVQL
jgi:hypothetical protein